MSIRRGPRPDSRFYTVNKDLSEDKRLSWAARGLLIFLLGKPDNWEVSVAHLIKQTEGSVKPSGRDAVRGILKELIETGYMQADIRRQEGGAFNGMDYVVHEIPVQQAEPEDQSSGTSPQPENPSPDEPETPNPSPDEPEAAEPLPVDPLLIKNDFKQGMIEARNEDKQIPDAEKSAPEAGESFVPAVLSKQQQVNPKETELQAKCRVAWTMYKAAYTQRHEVPPVRNAKVNSQVKQLVQRLGDEAGPVAEFYVLNVNNLYVLENLHDLGLLLSKAEVYRTQWATGRTMTQTRARQMDSTQANASAVDEALAIARARRNQGGTYEHH